MVDVEGAVAAVEISEDVRAGELFVVFGGIRAVHRYGEFILLRS